MKLIHKSIFLGVISIVVKIMENRLRRFVGML